MELIYKTIGQELYLKKINNIIASESMNYLKATFEFDTSWDGFIYTAVFCIDPKNIRADNIWAVMLDDNNTCNIPEAVLQNRGRFYVGVFGIKAENTRITSTFVEMNKEKGAAYYIPENQLTLYEQILLELINVQNELKTKQNLLIEGANITITDNDDGTSTISAADLELFIIVEELPTEGILNRIYLVPENGEGFEEWAYIDGVWVLFGNLTVDLSSFYTKAEVDNKIERLDTEIARIDTQINTNESNEIVYTVDSDRYAIENIINNLPRTLNDNIRIENTSGYSMPSIPNITNFRGNGSITIIDYNEDSESQYINYIRNNSIPIIFENCKFRQGITGGQPPKQGPCVPVSLCSHVEFNNCTFTGATYHETYNPFPLGIKCTDNSHIRESNSTLEDVTHFYNGYKGTFSPRIYGTSGAFPSISTSIGNYVINNNQITYFFSVAVSNKVIPDADAVYVYNFPLFNGAVSFNAAVSSGALLSCNGLTANNTSLGNSVGFHLAPSGVYTPTGGVSTGRATIRYVSYTSGGQANLAGSQITATTSIAGSITAIIDTDKLI